MAANTAPIYTRLGDIEWATSPAISANTTTDLTSGTTYLCFSADPTNGGYVQRIRFRSLGTNAASTVARVWINNGGTTGTAANNILFDEISLPSTTITQTAALANYELPLNFALPPSYTIYVTLGTAPGVNGWAISVIGGKY